MKEKIRINLAKHRQLSVNKLIEELSTVALTEFDNEIRFRTLAAQGNIKQGLAVLDQLDQHFDPT